MEAAHRKKAQKAEEKRRRRKAERRDAAAARVREASALRSFEDSVLGAAGRSDDLDQIISSVIAGYVGYSPTVFALTVFTDVEGSPYGERSPPSEVVGVFSSAAAAKFALLRAVEERDRDYLQLRLCMAYEGMPAGEGPTCAKCKSAVAPVVADDDDDCDYCRKLKEEECIAALMSGEPGAERFFNFTDTDLASRIDEVSEDFSKEWVEEWYEDGSGSVIITQNGGVGRDDGGGSITTTYAVDATFLKH